MIQNRGVKDIFIACVDGLKGYSYSSRTLLRPGKQDQQLRQFDEARKKPKPEDFSSAKLQTQRLLWK